MTLPAALPPTPTGQAFRCLVVDDEPGVRDALVLVLSELGLACVPAASALEALAIIDREPAPFEVVVTDMRMPGMSGLELLRHLRATAPDTAVVVCTAVSDVETAVECLREGAGDYLTKPFIPGEIQARVLRALERRQLMLDRAHHEAHLERTVRAQAERIENLFLAGIQSLADALELRDPYTAGHSLRVSRHAVAVARVLGLPETEVRDIEIGARLHDIGKIAIHENVLQKDAPLSEEEYAYIMTHPISGWRLLQPLLHDHPLALDVVRSHHERWDGRGRPDRLAGDQIPLAARIVAVADAYDAMMSARPYRPALGIDAALAELATHAGTQFDPDVVDAFARAIRTGTVLREEPPPIPAATE